MATVPASAIGTRKVTTVSPLSVLVPPRTYSVKLTGAGPDQTSRLVIRKDPNTAGSETDVQTQTTTMTEIRALPWIAAAQITLRVRVRIDESGCDDQSTHVDGALRRQVRVAGIADEDDPIAANRDVGNARRPAGSVDDGATTKKEVHVFAGRVRGSRDGYREECPG